jgi:hypothetical protein
MKVNILPLMNSLNEAYMKVRPDRPLIEIFGTNQINFFDQVKESESEEFH